MVDVDGLQDFNSTTLACSISFLVLRSEIESCKPSTSIVEHVSICTRCRDVDINAIHDHMALIKQQNDHIAKLDAKIAEHNLENEKTEWLGRQGRSSESSPPLSTS